MNAIPDFNTTDYKMVERDLCSRSLGAFARRAWKVLEPETELKWGWCLDAVCEHLEAVHRGEINKLLINIPPGCMKSLMTGVIFPAWEWGPKNRRGLRFLGTSHKEPLAIRDNIKCRRLITSDWYQNLWKVRLTSDQNAKTKFENDELGFREAMAFSSMTGSRGDRVILDDPLSVDDAKSETVLEDRRLTFTESLPTRINDPEKSAIIVIMQRLHMRDTSGIILSEDRGYTHLMLPMRYEQERKCHTSIGFKDPREVDGELLFPERFSEEYVTKEENEMGAYATAGQFQQRPAPRGGGMFKEEWLPIIRRDQLPKGLRTIRAWDLAGSERKKSPYTVGVKASRDSKDNVYIEHVVRFRKSPGAVERLMKRTAEKDGRQVSGSIPQDPGQAGKSQAISVCKKMRPFRYTYSTETGDKVQRAEPLATDAELGMVFLVEGPWNQTFIDEALVFPYGTYKDQIDAASRAYDQLMNTSSYTLDNL